MSRIIVFFIALIVFTSLSLAGGIEITGDIPMPQVPPSTITVNIYGGATGGTILATQEFLSGNWSADFDFSAYNTYQKGWIGNAARVRVNFTNTSGIVAGGNYWSEMLFDGNSYNAARKPVATGLARIPGYVVDLEGNTYRTVTIGTQEWMAENLRVTKYNDGTDIPLVTDGGTWIGLSTAAYCWYDNDIANRHSYGALYNWYAVSPTNPKQIAPDGWRVPTDADWTALENYLTANRYNYDFTTSDNKIAKSMAVRSHWMTSTNTGAIGNDLMRNNASGFCALPGGYRYYNSGAFNYQSSNGYWWSATENTSRAWSRELGSYYSYLDRNSYYKQCGFSVRLVRDLN